MWGEETPGRITFKFCLVIGTQDVITCIKFGDDRLRGFWSAGCQSLPFPIDFDGRPYNSATLPRALWSGRLIDYVMDSENSQYNYIWNVSHHFISTKIKFDKDLNKVPVVHKPSNSNDQFCRAVGVLRFPFALLSVANVCLVLAPKLFAKDIHLATDRKRFQHPPHCLGFLAICSQPHLQ